MQDRMTVRQILEREDDFVVAAHATPDGDALGSTCALGWILTGLGKNFRLYNASGIPDMFDWLACPAPVCTSLGQVHADGFTPKRWIILDCGARHRLGLELAEALDPGLVVNIDHHLGNDGYGAVNWVDTSFPAVGEMIAALAKDLGQPLSGPLGEAVYLAIASDTGNFTYGNTRAETMELAASIVRQGLSVGAFNAKYMKHWSMNRLKLWSEALAGAELHCGGAVGVVRVTSEQLARTSTSSYDLEGLVNFIRRVKGVRVAAMLRQDNATKVKFSLRSDGDDDVQRVAAGLGGGGHRNAAAGFVQGDLDQAGERLVRAITQELGLAECSEEPHAPQA